MDTEVIYTFVGIVILVIIIIVTLRSDVTQQFNTKEEKKEDIISEYKKQLQVALAPLGEDKEFRIAKKSELLKRFSNELSRNIFFDRDEIREVILGLSKEPL